MMVCKHSRKIYLFIVILSLIFVKIYTKNFHEINLNNSGINFPVSLEHKFCKMLNGNLVTIWAYRMDSISYGIYGIFTYPSSFTNSNMFLIKNGISSKSIVVSCLSGGGFVVAWYHNQYIYAVLYDNNGAIIKTEFQVNNTAISYDKLSIAAQTNGGFLIFYCRDQIYYRTANSNGQLTGSQGSSVVNTITQNFRSIGLSNGYTVFAWLQAGSLNFKIIKNDGNSITNTQFVSYSTAATNPKFDVSEIQNLGFVFTWEYSSYESVDYEYYNYEGDYLAYNYSWSLDYVDNYGLKNPHVVGLTNKNHIISFQYISSDGKLVTNFLFFNSNYDMYNEDAIVSRTMNNYEIIHYSGSSYVILYNNSDNLLSIIFFPSCLNQTMSVNKAINLDMSKLSSPQENLGSYKIVNLPTTGTLTINNSQNLINQLFDLSIPGNFTPDSADSNFTYSLYFSQYFGGEARCTLNLTFDCYSSCYSCDQIGSTTDHKCTACRISYYPLSDKSSQCYPSTAVVSGYYFSTIIFKKCKTDCITCTSESTCTQCLIPYTAVNNQCVLASTCPSDTFLDTSTSSQGICVNKCPDYYYGEYSTKLCLKCPLTNCKKCSDNTGICTLCESPYSLENQTCVLTNITCPSTEYFNSQNMACSPCPNNCSTCLNGTECTICLENYFLLPSKQCNSTCPIGTYLDGTMCKACMLNCESCTNATTCIKCSALLKIMNGTCIVECPINYFSSESLNECKACIPNCESCENLTECKNCSSGYYLNELKTCINECGLNFYEDSNTGNCENCILNCEECSNGMNCTKCKSNFYLQPDKTCKNTCPIEYYPDYLLRKCLPCGPNCENCNDGITCNKCKSNFFLNSLKICVDDCGNGYYNDISTRTCESCIIFCQNCQNKTSCLTCNTFYTLQSDGSCKGNCPDGLYFNFIEAKCEPCMQNCKSCNDEMSCILCQTKYFLDKDNNCTLECGSYLYENSSTGKCENCISNCEECKDNSTCLKCKENFYLLSSDSTCKTSCPSGYYSESNERACKACDSTCESCADAKTCDKCKLNYFMNTSNKCLSKCGAFFYEDSSEGKCKNCVSNCEECSNNYVCSKCQENYFLQPDNTTCKVSCPIGYFKSISDRKCLPCEANCETCTKSETCEQCQSNFFLDISTKNCKINCGVKHYGNINSGKCENCISNCEECTTNIECLKCSEDFYLQADNKCYDSCPIKYFKNKSTRKCDNCSDNCDKCIDTQICTNCEFPYFLSELGNSKICVQTCPAGYYADVDTGKCDALINICINNNPCQNNGICSVKDNSISCECPEEYMGSRCSEKVPEEKIPIEDQPIENDPLENIPNDPKELINYANDQIEKMLSGEVPPDPNILEVSNKALDTKINNILLGNSTNVDIATYQEEVNNMKGSIYSLSKVLLENVNVIDPVIISTDLFSVQLVPTDKSNKQASIDEARNKNLTIIEYGECEKKMIKHHNIPDGMPLLIKQIDYSSKLNLTSLNDTQTNTSSTIVLEFLDPRTKKPLDPNVCNDATIIIKSPNRKAFANLNITKYKKLSQEGVDMFDPNSEAFRSRCYILKDPDTGKDTTANYRINKYFGNKKAECAGNCQYKGLDEFGYVICSCQGLPKGEEKANSVQVEKLFQLPQMNFDIVTCVKVTFKYPDFFKNSAFYISGSFIIISLIVSKLLSKLDINIINKRINELIHYDCQFFDKEELSKEDYFNYSRKKVKKNPNLFNKIQANIDYVHPRKFKNDINKSFNDKKVSPFPVGGNSEENNKDDNQINHNSNPSYKIKKNKSKMISKKSKRIKIIKNFQKLNTESVNLSIGEKSNNPDKVINKKRIVRKDQNKTKLINQNKHESCPDYTDGGCSRNTLNKLVDDKLPAKIQIDVILEDMKLYTKRYRNIYEKNPNHSPTLRDYEELSPFDAVICDRRGFKQMFLNNLTEGHIVFELIFKVSILNPLWVRILFFFFNLTLIFAMNAIFFTDDLIDKRADSEQSVINNF